MKRINLENYKVNVITKEGIIEVPYDIKGSIKNIIFDPALQLNSIGLFESMNVWNLIKNEEKEVILEETQYNYIKKCMDIFKGYNVNDYEFVKRIQNAEDYEIKNIK